MICLKYILQCGVADIHIVWIKGVTFLDNVNGYLTGNCGLMINVRVISVDINALDLFGLERREISVEV